MFEKLVTAENKAYYCDFLARLADTLRKANRKYYNTSIFISKGKSRSTIKWIDFHYWGKLNFIQTTIPIATMNNLLKALRTCENSSRKSTLMNLISDYPAP